MVTTKKLMGLWAVMALAGSLASCTTEVETDNIDFTSGVRLTVIHTGDIHSRLLPYDMDLMATDERIGMTQANEPFGGIARAATVVKNIRASAQHSVHVDSGDVFQGAPIFNEFNGEVEIYALNYLGMDAFIIGNHEFDHGVANLYDKLSKAQFTILAANYQWKPSQGNEFLPLKDVARPYAVINADGVKVAVIGMANFSSMSSSTYGDNSLGITVLENIQVVQSYIDILKNEANVMTMVTHLGLGEDEDVIRKTEGLDVVFGGHLHIVLNPPKNIPDGRVDENGNPDPKMVPLVHSGAFMKYVGHFDGVFYPDYQIRPKLYVGKSGNDLRPWDLTLVSHKYQPIPIESNIPEDPELQLLIAPYERELAARLDLRHIVGYAPQTLKRFGTGGNDSPLGNFLADLMIIRQRVEADFGATNSLGIRTDVNQGPVTNDQLYNVFPFPNSLSSMYLSGNEVRSLLDYNTYRSMNRGCQSQLQVAGVRYTLDCHNTKRLVDDYLDLGFLFEYQYRTDAFNDVCRRVTPTPDYCVVTWEDKNNPANNIYTVNFAKDIKFVRGTCETDADCAFSEDGISKCEVISDTELGDYKACIELMQPQWLYKFATNDYMSHGGSGFSTLKYNTTQKNTGVMLREVLMDGIEKQKSCYDRCIDDAHGLITEGGSFDPANPGKCKRLQNCKDDTTKFELRWCKNLYKYSEQEVCLANHDITTDGTGPSRCAGLSKLTEKDNCMKAAYYKYCRYKFYEDDIANCYVLGEMGMLVDENGVAVPGNQCAAASDVSDYSICTNSFLSMYPDCSGLSAVSEYDKCVAEAAVTAENICRTVACFIASTDGRQNPERPHNEEVDGAISNIDSFSNGPAIMEALQAAGYDACY
ncbi:MAG: bifunctional metallophosphatase/5'-nucleotidase [Proteobacteria bacterium]|nr:bifunctional metallophosphatase/5'-nucleotidase [Pseudomonadota bacterium]